MAQGNVIHAVAPAALGVPNAVHAVARENAERAVAKATLATLAAWQRTLSSPHRNARRCRSKVPPFRIAGGGDA